MVRFNGIEFEIYDLDNQTSVLNRLAGEMNNIPKYLYFPDGIPTMQQLQQNEDIAVEDLLPIIRNSRLKFIQIYNQIKDKIDQQKLNLVEDVLKPHISFDIDIENLPLEFQAGVLMATKDELEKTKLFEKVDITVDAIWQDKEKFRQYLNNSIDENKRKTAQEARNFRQFDQLDSLNYTPFELEKVKLNLILHLENISLLEIFNNVKLNNTVPFATVNNFYKILKDFSPPEDWSMSLERVIIFKVLEKINTTNPKFDDFNFAVVRDENDEGQKVIIATLDLNTIGSNLSREEFINRFLGTLSNLGNINYETKEEQVNGVFYFPSHSMDKYVLADLVMNNPSFSSLLYIDESDKSSKKKSSIYVHFNHPRIGHVAANITEKIMIKGDTSMKGKSLTTFPLHQRYIRVKISKADNLETVREFQNMMSKLFTLYDNEYGRVVADYKQFIPNFGKVKQIDVPDVEKEKLKDIAPEIFLPGYSRQCPKRPTVISDEEAEEARKAGKQVMEFPIHGEGPPSLNYICNHDKHRFPGLRENPLVNKENFPFVPCCYAKDQEPNEGSKYRHYYYGEDLPAKEVAQQNLYTTNKFVPRDIFGTLPQNISQMFELIEPDERYMFVRKGVFRSKSSFLNCVMEALHDETGILDFDDEDEREARLLTIREELATPENAATCRQEMYDYTTDEIIEAIRNPDMYMDPKLFLHLLEVEYNCNIFIFTRKYISGEMSLPRHIQAYYKTKRRGRCIFIFEHIGSESDHATYPQCELIIKWRTAVTNEVYYDYPYDSPVSESVRQVFQTLQKSYVLDKQIQETVFPWNRSLMPESQVIDTYGKLRMLNVNFKGEIFSVITHPMQPGKIPETQDRTIRKLSLDTAVNFAAAMKIPITGQSVINGVVREINGVIGNVPVVIPINDGAPLAGVPIAEGQVSFPEDYISVIKQYNENKKLSRYIIEYALWLFSRYLNNNNIQNIETQTLSDFKKSMIRIDPNFNYQYISKTFSTSSGLMSRGKLIVKSEETLKRLLYVLRLVAVRNTQKLISYHTIKVIQQYYVDITDFDQYPFQVVLEGEESVDKWIRERKIKYNLRDDVSIGTLTPYFFKNPLVGDKVYLAQNVDSAFKGITIATTWFRDSYNPGYDVEESERVAFTLYAYTNPGNIEVYSVTGNETPYDIKMIGCKLEDDTNLFTVLLPL